MRRVNIYKPKLKRVQKGKTVEVVIEDKKDKLLRSSSVMDSTYRNHIGESKEDHETQIVHKQVYMELHYEEQHFEGLKRDAIDDIALDYGIPDPTKAKSKDELIGWIMKIQNGETLEDSPE